LRCRHSEPFLNLTPVASFSGREMGNPARSHAGLPDDSFVMKHLSTRLPHNTLRQRCRLNLFSHFCAFSHSCNGLFGNLSHIHQCTGSSCGAASAGSSLAPFPQKGPGAISTMDNSSQKEATEAWDGTLYQSQKPGSVDQRRFAHCLSFVTRIVHL
jgi:hypothetical protein